MLMRDVELAASPEARPYAAMQGPPEELVATFHKLFDRKIKETKSLAAQAAKRYGLLPGLIE